MYYWEYFKYVVEHKRNVWKAYKNISDFIIKNDDYKTPESFKLTKKSLRKRALIHDMSKFNPVEFVPYAKWFNGPYGVKYKGDSANHKRCKDNFERAWKHHYTKNYHHWNHWVVGKTVFSMPEIYILEMILDWQAMSYKFGGTPQEYYLSNYHKLKLDYFTRLGVERALGLNTLDITTNRLALMTMEEIKEEGHDLNMVFPNVVSEFCIDFDEFNI